MGWFYETKGCTLFPDGNYESCCLEHDRAYREQKMPRKIADRLLRRCVEERGHPVLAKLIYVGVRMFGWIRWNMMK